MKTLRIPSLQKIEVVDLPKPVAGEGEVLLRLKYVGFCGSDLNTFLGRNTMAKPNVIPGHEIGAVIEALGEGCPADLHEGQVVTVNPYTNCGHCASCRNGRYNACQNNETLGVQRDGAMREFIALPWQKIIPVKGVTPRDAALIEPMSVGFHAVSRGQVSDIDTVLVLGCGMVGLGAIIRVAHGDTELFHDGIAGSQLADDITTQNGPDQIEHGGGIHVGIDVFHRVADQVDDIGVPLQHFLQELVQQVTGTGGSLPVVTQIILFLGFVLAQPGIHQGLQAIQVLYAVFYLQLNAGGFGFLGVVVLGDGFGVLLQVVVDVCCFALSQFHIDTAEFVHNGGYATEVDHDVILDIHFEIIVHRCDGTLGIVMELAFVIKGTKGVVDG